MQGTSLYLINTFMVKRSQREVNKFFDREGIVPMLKDDEVTDDTVSKRHFERRILRAKRVSRGYPFLQRI